MKRIYVIVNKNWEVEPFLNALTNYKIRPKALLFPKSMIFASEAKYRSNQPRATIVYMADGMDIELQVWCIEDLMSLTVSSSNSEEKKRVLMKNIFDKVQPDLTIAVGTAGFMGATSYNGSVVMGSEFFIHNAKPPHSPSHFTHPKFDQLLPSNLTNDIFNPKTTFITPEVKAIMESMYLPAPNNPAEKPICVMAGNYVALSFVNVIEYTDYAWADQEAVDYYHKKKHKSPIGSIETTHGIIKLCATGPIFFMSGITDRLGYFNMDVTPMQNYVASFNCGITMAHMLPNINQVF